MTKLHNFLLATFIFCITNPIYSQFSRNDATDLILTQILADNLENVNVYSSFNTLPENGFIPLWHGQDLENPYSLSWYFFVDDMVFANWEHPCRYIFVDVATGNYNIIQKRISPQTLETDFEIIHEVLLIPK